jgi:hypothetical protein
VFTKKQAFSFSESSNNWKGRKKQLEEFGKGKKKKKIKTKTKKKSATISIFSLSNVKYYR